MKILKSKSGSSKFFFRIGLVLATASLLLAAKCDCKMGATGGIDTKNVEAEILKGAQSKGVTKVTCPESADGKIGTVFECTATTAQGDFPLTVTVTGDNGQFSYADKVVPLPPAPPAPAPAENAPAENAPAEPPADEKE